MNTLLKTEGLGHNGLTIIEEFNEYLSQVKSSGIHLPNIINIVNGYVPTIESTKYDNVPVCVLSHMYDKRRSKFIVNLLAEAQHRGLDRQYYIFTYDNQKNLYEQFESIPGINVVYIDSAVKKNLSLPGKRQYILEWCQNNNHDHGFFIEDDCYKWSIAIGSTGKDGTANFRNKQFILSNSAFFSFWEYLIGAHGLSYSSPGNNMLFAFRDGRIVTKAPILKPGLVMQSVHINTKQCKDLGINYDDKSGWDDFDFLISQCVYNQDSQLLTFLTYTTPTMTSGVSVESNSREKLEARCKVSTDALMTKWGTGLVKLDLKKGLYNAKPNWTEMAKARKAGRPYTSLLQTEAPNETKPKLFD